MKTEFEFINALRLKSKIQNPKSKVQIGIGDDCAVIRQNSKTDLVITADLLVQDIDFRLDWTTPEFIGHKALAVSLSDVAAMGAKPTWALVSIGVPTKIWQSNFVEEFYKGWFNLAIKISSAMKLNFELVGGDVSKTPDKIVIDSIVAGEVKKNEAILRSGAKVGDLIFVTGELGGAAAGLKLLEKELQTNEFKDNSSTSLTSRQIAPFPQSKTGEFIGKKQLATAMIDLSDGLSSDLTHLCESSEVGARIDKNKIPIHGKLKNYRKYSALKEFDFDIFSLALNGGEDFELLFTVNPKNLKKIEKHLRGVSLIGEVVEQNQGITLVENEKITPLKAEGFRHF